MSVAFTPWRLTLARAALSGSAAAGTSLVALALRGRRDAGSALAPINAVSHWLWGRRATRQNRASAKYTLLGALTQTAASIFWALLFERLLGARGRNRPGAALVGAAATAAVAAAVDYTITPRRLRPGYETRLSLPSLVIVYVAFASGMALAEAARARR